MFIHLDQSSQVDHSFNRYNFRKWVWDLLSHNAIFQHLVQGESTEYMCSRIHFKSAILQADLRTRDNFRQQ